MSHPPLRHKNVAVAIIYDPQHGFLLWNNKRWGGYAFPMKQFDAASSGSAAETALESLDERELPLNWSNATATPLDRVVELLRSESVRQCTEYDYHVFCIDSGEPLPDELPPEMRRFSYDELMAALNVTESTKLIAQSLLDDRQVAAAIITRVTNRGHEFLVIQNREREYFFPATRLKLNASPTAAVLRAMPMDLAYDGEIAVVDQTLVECDRPSDRFGRRETRFIRICACWNSPVSISVRRTTRSNKDCTRYRQRSSVATAPRRYNRIGTG